MIKSITFRFIKIYHAYFSGSLHPTRYFTPTWKPFFLNIDHALAKGLNVSARTLPWQHSDHRPILAEYTGQ
ncbi:hypothetical protein [Eikenella corrodens]|uniref:hypothetical protein n=1 Tax=Eikenella corrodens TaxID=539 RepID=UPI0028EC7553|nr:hypothetical protein [Eikenella corrodens]